MRTKLPRQATQACRSPRHRDAIAALLIAVPSVLFAGGLWVHAATKPGPSRDIGYIERIVGDLKNIRIERQGKSLQPAILLPLRADDRIFLRQGSEVYLQLGNRRIVIAEKDSPYRVPAVDAPPAFVTRLRSTLLSLGAKLTSQYARSSVPVSTSSRGHEGPLLMLVVEDENSRLATHHTALNLAWEGGTAPFVVEFLSGQGERLAKQERVEDWRLRLMFGTASIPEGPAHVVVEDSTGTRISKLIQVVPASALPARAPQSDIPPALHAVIAADELIRTNHRQWGLEAYQDLADLAASYEPARLLRDCLEAVPNCYQP